MDLLVLANAADNVSAMDTEVSSPEEGYEIVAGDSLDFDSWILLISEIEKTYSNNIKAISSVYESFLSWFPLCHEYWKRYADLMARLCTVEKAVEIFEQAVQSATYSVDMWVDYCSFSVLAFADPSDVRRMFERGLSYVGKDFLCHRLWDLYIRFELSQQQWSFLARILIRALKFPTKSLHKYYDSFKEFVAFVEEDMSFSKSGNLEPFAAGSDIEVAKSNNKIYLAIKELQDSSSVDLRTKALNKLIAIGERFYRKSCKLHEEIDYFENYMDRDSFNVKPLDDEELQNWHNYLDFIEKQEDFDWAVKLYERCLIPCANYPEFWMRYVDFMESKGGRELANFALERATQVFLKNLSEVHIFNARFREKIGDIEGARAAFHLCDTESDSSFIETAIKEANMETRLGNMDTALEIYDKALKIAVEKEKMHIIPILYIHFFRLKFMITGSADAAMDLLIAGIQQVPFSRLLLEELINFAMIHEGSKYLDVVDGIISTAVTFGLDGSQGLSAEDREYLSNLYLKLVDYCGTTHDIRKAWNRHIKSFPHLIRSASSHNYPSNRLSNGPRERIPRLVAKQPSRVHRNKHITQISANENQKLTSKNQAIQPCEAAGNHHGEKDDDNSVIENTRNQQSEDKVAGELKRLKLQSRNDSQNDLQVSQEDQIRTEQREHDDETCTKPVSLEKEPNESANKQNQDSMSPSTANQNPFPATDSAKKPNGIDEHEPETDLQQTPSQNVETCKNNHLPTASEHLRQLPNLDHPNVPNVQPESSSSASELHLLPQNVQPVVQCPVPSSEQPGVIQNPQTYNQMWQYQYQQQHQNQQQWLQMQQSYQQPYIQQQQQFQPQQYQYYQQLEQYQQYWFQMYQQQQPLQQYNMQMQQYQQMQQQQQPPPLVQANTAMAYAQANHANVIVQPMASPTPTKIVSPTHLQPLVSKSLPSPAIE